MGFFCYWLHLEEPVIMVIKGCCTLVFSKSLPCFLPAFLLRREQRGIIFSDTLKTTGTEIAIWTKAIVHLISLSSLTAAEPETKDCFSFKPLGCQCKLIT